MTPTDYALARLDFLDQRIRLFNQEIATLSSEVDQIKKSLKNDFDLTEGIVLKKQKPVHITKIRKVPKKSAQELKADRMHDAMEQFQTKKDAAAYLGISERTLYRHLAKMKKAGYIYVKHHLITE